MNIGIIGFGRFGQFIATILKKNYSITVYDNKDKKEKAENANVKWDTLENVCQQDLIILAVPISEIENILKEIKEKVKNNSIVMDVCSVKEYPSKLMLKHLPNNVEIISSHPMFGPDSAKNGLKDLQMIFCPLRISKEKQTEIESMFRKLGIAVIELTTEEHDKQSARSLCLVHFLGRGLEKMKIAPQKVTTLGFERLLKVQETVINDSIELFRDMQTYNRFAKPLRKQLIEFLYNIDKSLDNN